MDSNQQGIESLYHKTSKEIDNTIAELEEKIEEYGSFNLIAYSIFKNQVRIDDRYEDNAPETQHTASEYLALIVLKFPFSLGIKELTHANNLAQDFFEINKLVNNIIGKYTYIHYSKFNTHDETGKVYDLEQMAQLFSANELLVRNQTFESYHWDLLDSLYEPFDEYFENTLGFNVNEAIIICETIADHMNSSFKNLLINFKKHFTEMYDEIIAYKYRKKMPHNFYPPEYLERFKRMEDESIKREFIESMFAYELSIIGYRASFTAEDIAKLGDIELNIVKSFLDKLSIKFGDVEIDFKRPEIMHPLKNKPLITHEERYLCCSTSLLDYSLDRLFAETLLRDNKKREKYKQHRHDYLLKNGMDLLAKVLKTNDVHTNLYYPNGEMDGLIFCDSNIYFIEAKSHRITDRAKKGYIDRLENHIDEIVKSSYSQALRTYNYLFGKSNVEFKDKSGRSIFLNGSGFQNAYFISLTLEDISVVSCNLKVNNSIFKFEKDSFPWIVSLYDLRAVCEHMEGPSYFIQYLHRRKEFFKNDKFIIQDELDVLAYYLKRNLRFDDMLEQFKNSSLIMLDSYLDDFNNYYLYIEGHSKKSFPKMTHYSKAPIKNLVKALEESGVKYGKDAGAQILELGSKTKDDLIIYTRKIKKMFSKDNYNHDFRIGGDDVNNHKWMLSYWVGPDHPDFIKWFEDWILKKFKDEPTSRYIAILDCGKNNYQIKRIINLQS